MKNLRKIYFMGIKGVGMATLAVIAKEAGFIVTGSDIEQEFITDKILKKAGIDCLVGFEEKNVEDFIGETPASAVLFISTGAHNGFENPETIYARQRGVRTISHGEAVGLFMSGELFDRKLTGVSIAGAHGKTTISGMIAYALSKLGQDASFTIGTSEIPGVGSAGHYGKGKYFIAEADEYVADPKHDPTPKFLYQKPLFLIINNIDFDHPDVYPDIESVVDAYKKFATRLEKGACLIANGDDQNVRGILKDISNPVITYGASDFCEYRISGFAQEGLSSTFKVSRRETLIGDFTLGVPGYHNAKNSLAVIALLMEIGMAAPNIQKALSGFAGVARRFEKVYERENGAIIFDDYAHHPEEIKKTLDAARAAFPKRKITVVFQAHTYARTRALLSEFASSFSQASEVIILPTFASVRDAGVERLDEDREFVEKIRMVQSEVVLFEDEADVVKYLKPKLSDPDVLIFTLGAGDVYKVASVLSEK
jgi:UDP-N-acetylmuramate--alanine ligase